MATPVNTTGSWGHMGSQGVISQPPPHPTRLHLIARCRRGDCQARTFGQVRQPVLAAPKIELVKETRPPLLNTVTVIILGMYALEDRASRRQLMSSHMFRIPRVY